ncbi:TRAM domain-containing protein, partial [Zobellella denitrificans]|uniref:TRAM domain-containing protein n=1 Tax=Zobellella denitrificans TaxID=347534 RepID=UPI00115C65F7
MVQFFKVKKPDVQAQAPLEVEVLELNAHGVGVARHQGKPLFVPGVLAGERVRVRLTGQNSKYRTASLAKVLRASPQRQKPFCPYTAQCGGCSLQHVPLVDQRHMLQRTAAALGGIG